MRSHPLSEVVQRLRAAAERDGGRRTDGELLAGYLSRRDDDALAALVERHAPMVWGVCRRILRHHQDAEDAFQATFIVLVRKAAAVVPREMVANWLYGVARQTAVRRRATAAKRGGREMQTTELPDLVVADARDTELLSLLDHELSRLPKRFRALIVLCDLEGKSRKEVARQLDCPEGTVASGIARAREMLAKRLTRRGVAVSGGALAALLSAQAASAGAPSALVVSTIQTATLVAAGKAVAAGAVSGQVAALTEGVMNAMLLTKLTSAIAVGLMIGFVATGMTVVAFRTAAGQDDKKTPPAKAAEPAVKQGREGGLESAAAEKSLEPFQGMWQVSEAAERGKPGDPDIFQKHPVVFDGDQLTMIYAGDKTMKWTVTVRPDKTPAEIDAAFPKDVEKGKVIRGIYTFEDGVLTLALGLDKDSTRPTKFASADGEKPTLLMVLKRATASVTVRTNGTSAVYAGAQGTVFMGVAIAAFGTGQIAGKVGKAEWEAALKSDHILVRFPKPFGLPVQVGGGDKIYAVSALIVPTAVSAGSPVARVGDKYVSFGKWDPQIILLLGRRLGLGQPENPR